MQDKKIKDRPAAARKITMGLDIWTTKVLPSLPQAHVTFALCRTNLNTYYSTSKRSPIHILPIPSQLLLPENKILTVITDNGSNMVAAFRSEEEEPSSADLEEDEGSEGEHENEEAR